VIDDSPCGTPRSTLRRRTRLSHLPGDTWLKTHFTESFSVESLAKRVGLSPSSLHQHFKSITAPSPLQYQKQLRLQEARRLLLGESLDAADAAYRVGYESPSQFSREYRRMFGAPPRKDVAAIKVDA
jgi:AraC-like DNA-binding protein